MGRLLGAATPVAQCYENECKTVNFFHLNEGCLASSKGHVRGKCPPEKRFASKGVEIEETILGVELNLSASY